MAVGISLLLIVVTVLTTTSLVRATLRLPQQAHGDVEHPVRREHPSRRAQPGAIRLASRVLFARRTFDSLTLDCTLVRVEQGLPPDLDPPEGLPFTLRLRCPDTSWFAGRVEELLNEWAEENRELLVELTPENGKVRTMIASGDSSIHLELSGAAGLGANRPA